MEAYRSCGRLPSRAHACWKYGWDGDTLAWESKIADEDGFGARTTSTSPAALCRRSRRCARKPSNCSTSPSTAITTGRMKTRYGCPAAAARTSHQQSGVVPLGTPQELTDEHSGIAWSAEYRAWGVAQEAIRKASGKALIANPIRFQGQYHDHESGLHYNRYRYYDPQVGRYITQDPIELAGGLNVYQYAWNPISWIDPLGLQTGPVLLGMGNLYRASAQPPLPTLSSNTSIKGIYGDVSNLAFPSPVLPGEWVGVNVQWSMPTIKQFRKIHRPNRSTQAS